MVPRSAAPGSVSTRIERAQAQNVPRVDRIGIAQPILDLGHRKASWPRGARRCRSGLRRRSYAFRPVKLACPGKIVLAALDGPFPAVSSDGGESLDEARWHCRRACDLGGMAQDNFARAEKLCEIVGGESDATLRQIEPERKPHRPAQPSVVVAFRRPRSFDETTEHDAIVLGQARFERTEDLDAQSRLRLTADHAASKRCRKQFDVIGCVDGKTGSGLAGCEFIEHLGKLLAVAAGQRNCCGAM